MKHVDMNPMNQENTTPEEFREGDFVEHVITGQKYELERNLYDDDYPLITTDATYSFTKCGRTMDTHKYPSIRLIKRPKKQKKVEVIGYVNICSNTENPVLNFSKASAKERATSNAIAVAVEMRGHYFIEED